jgi:SAM-dependent methyltransferase
LGQPTWKLPTGVSRGTWDYVQSPHIARDYDQYFATHPLMKLDLEFLEPFLPTIDTQHTAPVVADLGCGTGRVSRALSPRGYRMINIDLSEHMLGQLSQQSLHPAQQLNLRANLAEMNCLSPQVLDMAVCLFSSLGMIRGHQHRLRCLQSLKESLKPGAPFILHAHNRYHSLWDPTGPAWLVRTRWKSLVDKNWEFGDRVYAYRGLPSMFLHIFSRGELRMLLSAAGFEKVAFHPINLTGDRLLPETWSSPLRAGGYFVVCK